MQAGHEGIIEHPQEWSEYLRGLSGGQKPRFVGEALCRMAQWKAAGAEEIDLRDELGRSRVEEMSAKYKEGIQALRSTVGGEWVGLWPAIVRAYPEVIGFVGKHPEIGLSMGV